MHEIASRTMFVAMALIAALLAMREEMSTGTRVLGVIFVVFAAISIFGYMTNGAWFKPVVLVWESSYILAFLIMMTLARERV